MIHLYFGEGKGKTTAALGLALRFSGSGGKVIFCQFLKSRPVSELTSLEKLGIEVMRGNFPKKFFAQMTLEERTESRKITPELFDSALGRAESFLKSQADGRLLLVFDEICATIAHGLLDEAYAVEKIKGLSENPKIEVVLTGRNPSETLFSLADYATEMKKIRHPFDSGIVAREGVEF